MKETFPTKINRLEEPTVENNFLNFKIEGSTDKKIEEKKEGKMEKKNEGRN